MVLNVGIDEIHHGIISFLLQLVATQVVKNWPPDHELGQECCEQIVTGQCDRDNEVADEVDHTLLS